VKEREENLAGDVRDREEARAANREIELIESLQQERNALRKEHLNHQLFGLEEQFCFFVSYSIRVLLFSLSPHR